MAMSASGTFLTDWFRQVNGQNCRSFSAHCYVRSAHNISRVDRLGWIQKAAVRSAESLNLKCK